MKILQIRCNEEEVEINIDAMKLLTKIGSETSLRYASNLISVSNLIAKKRRSETVELEDIKRSYLLFLDSSRSVAFLQENESNYIDDDGNVQFGSKVVSGDAMEVDS